MTDFASHEHTRTLLEKLESLKEQYPGGFVVRIELNDGNHVYGMVLDSQIREISAQSVGWIVLIWDEKLVYHGLKTDIMLVPMEDIHYLDVETDPHILHGYISKGLLRL